MADNVTVSPTPIQRNANDVAIELFKFHSRSFGVAENEIEQTYAKYYALAKYLQTKNGSNLTALIDQDILNKISK
jgi:hypothetical protein